MKYELRPLDQMAGVARAWQDKNFGTNKVTGALALCEEVGEVARAVVKTEHGIRPKTRGDVGEEIGDVLLAAIALAHRHGLKPSELLNKRFARAMTLDFTKDPEGGKQ